jgi:hypothetical protein
MTTDNPKGFNAAVLAVIDFLGGDRSSGKCRCPIHGDRNPLSVSNGDKWPVVLHCFGGGRNHDQEIIDYLHSQGAWPSSAHFDGPQAKAAGDDTRSRQERRRYALAIYKALYRSFGREMAGLLKDYFERRGLKRVPPEALLTMPPHWVQAAGLQQQTLPVDNVGMVVALRDKHGKVQGIQVTWLNPDLKGKREQEPQRQSYGLLKGNFLELEQLDYEHRLQRLLIGEGTETAEAAAQLVEQFSQQRPRRNRLGESSGTVSENQQRPPAIACGGKGNMASLEPPDADEYVLLVDHDEDGGSRKHAGMLAQRLVGSVVRIATPPCPQGGKKGYDWNDALIDAKGNEVKLKELARAIIEAPPFEQVMTDAEKREMRINALAHLYLDDHLAYEQEREAAGKALKLRLSVLDEEVERRCKVLREERERERAKPTPVNMELLEASARDIIASEDVLELFAQDCSRMIAGEKVNLKMLLLSGTSRLFEHKAAINLALKGPSGGGKSETPRPAR